MKYASLKIHKLKYKLPQPLSIATYSWTHIATILVKLHYDGFTGIGEAAPFSLMTGENYDYVLAQLGQFKNCVIDPDENPAIFCQQIHKRINSRHAAAALDSAFLDLQGKIQNKPVYALFGSENKLTPNSLTIPVLSLEETKLFALKILENYPQVQLIKIKLDNDIMNPQIVKIIKEVFPKNVSFVIDPNQCFKDSHHAIHALDKIQSILETVIAIEQPVEKYNYQGLLDIKNNFPGIDVFADESLVGMEDLEKLIETDAVTGINIKIQKAGGIWNAKLMAQKANEAGLKVMVGCMMESPLGVAAGIHFAVSTPNVAFTDLDSDLFLFKELKEPILTTSPFIEGRRVPFEKPGLGIEIYEESLQNLVNGKEIIYEEIK